jgi:hypothetical protein
MMMRLTLKTKAFLGLIAAMALLASFTPPASGDAGPDGTTQQEGWYEEDPYACGGEFEGEAYCEFTFGGFPIVIEATYESADPNEHFDLHAEARLRLPFEPPFGSDSVLVTQCEQQHGIGTAQCRSEIGPEFAAAFPPSSEFLCGVHTHGHPGHQPVDGQGTFRCYSGEAPDDGFDPGEPGDTSACTAEFSGVRASCEIPFNGFPITTDGTYQSTDPDDHVTLTVSVYLVTFDGHISRQIAYRTASPPPGRRSGRPGNRAERFPESGDEC